MADVFFALCLLLTLMYGVLCVTAGIQLTKIIVYRHNVQSFHFAFLALVFLWTALRVIWFCPSAVYADVTGMVLFWFPVDLQFATFSLLVVFYCYLIYKLEWEAKRRVIVAIYIAINLSVIVLTSVYIILACKDGPCTLSDSLESAHHMYMAIQFLLLVLVYAVYGFRLSISSQSPGVDARTGLRQGQTSTLSIVLITISAWLIFVSRCVYYFLAAFQVFIIDIKGDAEDKQVGWLAFGLLVVWEIIPTLMVLVYFRKIPKTQAAPGWPFSWLAVSSKVVNEASPLLDTPPVWSPSGPAPIPGYMSSPDLNSAGEFLIDDAVYGDLPVRSTHRTSSESGHRRDLYGVSHPHPYPWSPASSPRSADRFSPSPA